MPELPEVETVRRGLQPWLEGHRLARVQLRRADLRFPFPPGFARRLNGRTVHAIDRRGKYLLIRLDNATVWLAHLGMSGRFIVDRGNAGEDRHDHVVIETDAGVCIRFRDPRRFGFMDLVAEAALTDHPLLASLGPEPLGDGFTVGYLAGRLAGRAAPIKAFLLDQRNIAGLGNIYVCESLFWAGLSPQRPAGSVHGVHVGRLVDAVRQVLTEAIAAGGSSLRDHRQPSGELGYFQTRFAVYDRAGATCPGCVCENLANGGIQRIVQSGRSTYYCPRRQR